MVLSTSLCVQLGLCGFSGISSMPVIAEFKVLTLVFERKRGREVLMFCGHLVMTVCDKGPMGQ